MRSEIKRSGVDSSQIEQVKNQLQAYQTSAWMQAMDQVAGAGTSKAFAQFLKRDDVQNRIGGYTDSLSHRGLAESMADSMAPGGIRGNFANASQMIGMAVDRVAARQIESTRARIAQYSNDPLQRAGVIIGSIDGLSQHDRSVAEQVIKDAFTAGGGQASGLNALPGLGIDVRPGNPSGYNAAIEQAVKNTNYKDPGLRRVMGIVAKNWDTAASGTDRVVDRLAKGEH
jgi:hypothetical protein